MSDTVTVTVADDLIHARVLYHAGDQFDTTPEHAALLAERGLLIDENATPEPDVEADETPADPYKGLVKADLEQLAAERELEVTGTGKDSAVKVDDLLAALRAADAEPVPAADETPADPDAGE